MGCTSSKRIDTVDAYRPAPSSFSVFDVTNIQEPWLKDTDEPELPKKNKSSHLPAPLLEKLNAIEDAPRSWDEVSKELEDLKPKLNNTPPAPNPNKKSNSTSASPDNNQPTRRVPRKSFSFHTLEELESKTSQPTTAKKPSNLKKSQSTRNQAHGPTQDQTRVEFPPGRPELPKSLQDNIFLIRDREEREKEGKKPGFLRWNPLNDFEEKCPPGGEEKLVVYTTSLRGVRRTFEDCSKVRQLLETHVVVFDERDVSLHAGFLSELKELLGEGVSVPRVFVKGRYLGGADEVVGLNETGKFSRILNWARVERGVGRMGCDGCGGLRFVPCLECGGSCKVVKAGGSEKERCGECNENGLVHCPVCM